MPDIFVGFFERAKTNRDTENALTAPILAWHQSDLSNALSLAAVDEQLDRLVYIGV